MRKIRKKSLNGFSDNTVREYETSHRSIAERAAAEGMVLLKNEKGLLPLKTGSKVALYGIGASRTVKGGTGSGDVNERKAVSIWEGMKNAGFIITNEEWLRDFDVRCDAARLAWRDKILSMADLADGMNFFDVYSRTPFEYPVGRKPVKTDAEVAFYILSRIAGEGADRKNAPGDYQLKNEEKEQLSEICLLYPQVVVAVNTGGPVDLGFVDEHPEIKALLFISQPGMEGGNAFADVISGKAAPSGKLTDTWTLRYEDYPNAKTFSYCSGDTRKEQYEEGIYVGYRYFDSFQVPVRFGFGDGLPYTSFAGEMTDIRITYPKEDTKVFYGSGDPEREAFVHVSVKVENTGRIRNGRDTRFVFVSCPDGRLEKEARRLAGFAKTKELTPGESEILQIDFPVYAMSSFDEKIPGWVLEKGTYGIWGGRSLESSVLMAKIELKEEKVLNRTEHICPKKEDLSELCLSAEKREERYASWRDAAVTELALENEKLPETQAVYGRETTLAEEEARKTAEGLSDEQLTDLVIGDPGKGQGGVIGAAAVTVPGAAGETGSLSKDCGVASIILADGPAGLRLEKEFDVEDGIIKKREFFYSFEQGIFASEKESAAEACGMTGAEGGAEAKTREKRYQYCSAFPVGTLLAQTFDTELVREVGRAAAEEMQIFNVTLWLAPGMNIHRNPLCGRNFEYYSEDPYVSGTMAAAMTQGVQSVHGCGTTIKHFAGNNQEDNRMGSNDIISERTLREIYLKGFEIAVKTAHPMALMTSYNLINGVHSANNADLCTKALRNEWGFDGMVMTDWTTTTNSTDSAPCTASGCIRAGNDVVMPGAASDFEDIRKALADGSLTRRELEDCAARVIETVFKSNEYESS